VALSATSIPFDLILVNRGTAVFDLGLRCFVVAVAGPYRFDFTVTLSDTGTGAAPEGVVGIFLEVGTLNVSGGSVQRQAAFASFSNAETESKTVAGSAILELLPQQTVSLACVNLSGNSSSSIVGGAASSSPVSYATLFSGASLF
jgi:hypothetical protein